MKFCGLPSTRARARAARVRRKFAGVKRRRIPQGRLCRPEDFNHLGSHGMESRGRKPGYEDMKAELEARL